MITNDGWVFNTLRRYARLLELLRWQQGRSKLWSSCLESTEATTNTALERGRARERCATLTDRRGSPIDTGSCLSGHSL